MSSTLTPIDIAFQHLLATLKPVVEDEDIPVEEALGRVLACDSIAQMNVPPMLAAQWTAMPLSLRTLLARPAN